MMALALLLAARAALLVGENAGDRADAPLRYAESDAAAFREVLVHVGGFSGFDVTLLRGASAADLQAALESLRARLVREHFGEGDRLIVYVSAHASDGELHLRGTRFPLATLRKFLDETPAGLSLLVLDTCESGAALRAKGFEVVGGAVRIEQPRLRGRVVIASTGADEPAFESDELRGSIFTQHFLAGLRGAADSSGDGKVTLTEAYSYAYARTVDSAAAGEQRQTPVFDIDLQGAGELVLSEPVRAQSRLALDVERPGEWVVTSMDGARQVARFVKRGGRAVFALDPGDYRLRARVGDHYQEDEVHLLDGRTVEVREADLRTWKLVPSGRKGSGASTRITAAGAVGSGAVSTLSAMAGFSLGLRRELDVSYGEARPILAANFLELVGTPSDRSFLEQEVSLAAGGGVEQQAGPVLVRALVEVGATGVRQTGRAPVFAAEPRLEAQLGAEWRFGRLSADAMVGAGGLLVRTQENRHFQPLAFAAAGVGWGW